MVEKRGEGVGNLMAALFGAITPFCSCSSVPLFIGFVQAGIPLGITFSFLITSPLMNEVALRPVDWSVRLEGCRAVPALWRDDRHRQRADYWDA
ncbi:MAG: permease [Chromatiales bacterium]|nr:permease [Chromatiales bacterium]